MNKEMIMGLYETNHWVLTRQADGLTHEDSLLQLSFRGNCFNWVVGHVLVSRENVLKMLGIEGTWTPSYVLPGEFVHWTVALFFLTSPFLLMFGYTFISQICTL